MHDNHNKVENLTKLEHGVFLLLADNMGLFHNDNEIDRIVNDSIKIAQVVLRKTATLKDKEHKTNGNS
jgi:hypothetical protein